MSIRKTAAVIGLIAFAALILSLAPTSSAGSPDRATLAMWGLLPVLGVALGGIARGGAWARWLALGGAVAVLPWALLLTIAPLGLPVGRPSVALAASLAILCGLARPSSACPGSARSSGPEFRLRELVGWTVAANIASILALYLFAVAFDFRAGWQVAVVGTFLALLLFGVVALGRGKTAGVLALALTSLGLLVTGGAYLAPEANHIGELLLLGAAFLPGIVMSAALVCALGRSLGRVVRGG